MKSSYKFVVDEVCWGFVLKTITSCQCSQTIYSCPICTHFIGNPFANRLKQVCSTSIVLSIVLLYYQYSCVDSKNLSVWNHPVFKETIPQRCVAFKSIQSDHYSSGEWLMWYTKSKLSSKITSVWHKHCI